MAIEDNIKYLRSFADIDILHQHDYQFIDCKNCDAIDQLNWIGMELEEFVNKFKRKYNL